MVTPEKTASTGNRPDDARLVAAAQEILRLQLDTNLRNVDRDALKKALGALREAVERSDQPPKDEPKKQRSVDSIWTNLSGQ